MLSTRGIVFRTCRFKESSLILDVFTEQKGIQSFFMNSVFNSKNTRLSSLLQVSNILEIVAYYSDKKEIHRIKEVNPDYLYESIPNDIRKSAIATFIIELSRRCVKDQSEHQDFFQLIRRCLVLLDRQPTLDANFHLKFMIKLSSYLGFQPLKNYSQTNNAFDLINAQFIPFNLNNHYCIDPLLSEKIFKLLNDELKLENAFKLSYEDRSRMLDTLIEYYKVHIENFGDLKSPSVYKSIL
ncbi:MAG: DNA repair protein RecO [Saprospiraceae bacterium]|nr:DNA repair protein RecO [Saprospiraceae bacterium]